MDEITLKAYGKINLALYIGKKRTDGYHDLSSVMQSVDLCDEVTVKKRADGKVVLSSNSDQIPLDGTNIAVKAANLMKEKFALSEGFDIFIDKKIPVGGGMAGGSSNAAAVIEAVNEICALAVTKDELCTLGKKIGADVPFCIYKKTALAEGVGERLTEVSPLCDCYIVLVNPAVNISTGKIFNMMDEENRELKDCSAMIRALEKKDFEKICSLLDNDMQKYTERCCGEIDEIIKGLKSAGAGGAIMSGSGSTCFGLFKDKPCEYKLKENLNAYWYCTSKPVTF